MLLASVTLVGAGFRVGEKFEGPEYILDSGSDLHACCLGPDFGRPFCRVLVAMERR